MGLKGQQSTVHGPDFSISTGGKVLTHDIVLTLYGLSMTFNLCWN